MFSPAAARGRSKIIFNQGNTPDREGLIVADGTSVDEGVPGAPGPVTHGIPGKRVPGKPFTLPESAGPEGTFVEEGGGGLAHGATS